MSFEPASTQGTPGKSAEFMVAVSMMLFALIGSAVLYYLKFPRIMAAIYLSAGATLMVYHLLGGIPQKTQFRLGVLRLGGSAAVLVGVAWWISSLPDLDPQLRFHVVSNDSIVGTWNWKWVDERDGMGYDGTLVFAKDHSFSGNESHWVTSKGGQANEQGSGPQKVQFLRLTNGRWSLSADHASLSLECDLLNDLYENPPSHLKTVEPLVLIPTFGGQLWQFDPRIESQPWGMMLTKNTSTSH
jgi:hypothetical protein